MAKIIIIANEMGYSENAQILIKSWSRHNLWVINIKYPTTMHHTNTLKYEIPINSSLTQQLYVSPGVVGMYPLSKKSGIIANINPGK